MVKIENGKIINPEPNCLKSTMPLRSEYSDLLADIKQLSNPDYHKLNKQGNRLLHAVLCAYAKHQIGRDEIGWSELSDILCDAICEEIGDDSFCEWTARLRS